MRIIIDPDPESLLPRKLGRRKPAGILLTFHQWKTLITENKPKLYNKTDDGEGSEFYCMRLVTRCAQQSVFPVLGFKIGKNDPGFCEILQTMSSINRNQGHELNIG